MAITHHKMFYFLTKLRILFLSRINYLNRGRINKIMFIISSLYHLSVNEANAWKVEGTFKMSQKVH